MDVVREFGNRTGYYIQIVFDQYLMHSNIPVLEYKLKKKKKGEFEITLRWVNTEEWFMMPVIISTGEESRMKIPCDNHYRTIKIKLKKATDFKVRDDLEYIEVRKISKIPKP